VYRWHLPGPHGYIEDVLRALRDGFNVVCAVPAHGVSGLGEALKSRLLSDGWALGGHFRPDDSNPMSQLYNWLDIADVGQTRRSITSIIQGMVPAAAVIVDGIQLQSWKDWKQLITAYEATSRNVPRSDRPLLIAVVEGVPEIDLGRNLAALKNLPWQNVVGEFDVMLYALEQIRSAGRRSNKSRLAARIVARLALWDFDLANQLVAMNESQLFEPLDCLRIATQHLVVPDSFSACWESGGMMQFDGVSLVHPYLLLSDAAKAGILRLRLWEALASDLLPVIETKRHDWAQEMRTLIRVPVQLGDQVFNDVDELEIGQLAFLAKQRNLSSRIRQGTEKLRRYRNKLAHIEPLSYAEAFDTDLRTYSWN